MAYSGRRLCTCVSCNGQFRIGSMQRRGISIGVARPLRWRGQNLPSPKIFTYFSRNLRKIPLNFPKFPEIHTKFPEILRIGGFQLCDFIFVPVSVVVVVVGRGRGTYKCNSSLKHINYLTLTNKYNLKEINVT